MTFHRILAQAADRGGAGGGAAAGEQDPPAAAAGGLPEDHQPAGGARPVVPAKQLAVRPAEPAALEREHGQDQQRIGLRVEARKDTPASLTPLHQTRSD